MLGGVRRRERAPPPRHTPPGCLFSSRSPSGFLVRFPVTPRFVAAAWLVRACLVRAWLVLVRPGSGPEPRLGRCASRDGHGSILRIFSPHCAWAVQPPAPRAFMTLDGGRSAVLIRLMERPALQRAFRSAFSPPSRGTGHRACGITMTCAHTWDSSHWIEGIIRFPWNMPTGILFFTTRSPPFAACLSGTKPQAVRNP